MRSTCGIRSRRCRSTSPPSRWSWWLRDGHYLIDDRGRRLFDGTSALWCNLLGHRVPEIDAAVAEQLGRFAHTTLLGTTHPGVAALARRLVEMAPSGLNHVFFSDNGATAVESALKIAFQYRLLTQGRRRRSEAVYLSLDNAYHGDTLGAAAVGGVELFHDIFKPILLPSLKTPSPYCYRCPIGKTPADCSIDCADELEQALARANGPRVRRDSRARRAGGGGHAACCPRVSFARGRGVPQARRAADSRRGGDGVRPHRHAVRLSSAKA